jgi:hypothetical protein
MRRSSIPTTNRTLSGHGTQGPAEVISGGVWGKPQTNQRATPPHPHLSPAPPCAILQVCFNEGISARG